MAFANPSPSDDVVIRVSIRQSGTWQPLNSVTLRPLHTEKLRVEAERLTAAFAANAPDTMLIRAEYSMTSTEVIANAWLEDEKSGFSNTALFHDEYPDSNKLYATQLVLGAFPDRVLPNGPRFDGQLVFVNLDASTSTLSATLYCAAEEITIPVTVPPQTLDPFAVHVLDLSSLAVGMVDSSRGTICSGEFSYTGKPGHVLGRYYAASLTKTYGVYVKLEPFVGWAYNEVYWTVEDDFVPLLTVTNFSADTDTIEVYVSEGEAIPLVYSKTVAPYDTFTLNMRELIKPLKASKTFRGDFGGMYIKTLRPTGRLLVKQHAISAKRLMMAPYYGGYNYIWNHAFNSSPGTMDVSTVSAASVTTCYAVSGCIYDDWFIYSGSTSIATVLNQYGVWEPRPVTAVGVGSTTLYSSVVRHTD
jgi:hypothetical protein